MSRVALYNAAEAESARNYVGGDQTSKKGENSDLAKISLQPLGPKEEEGGAYLLLLLLLLFLLQHSRLFDFRMIVGQKAIEKLLLLLLLKERSCCWRPKTPLP